MLRITLVLLALAAPVSAGSRLVVSCDCVAVDATIDGVFYNPKSSSLQVNDLAPGRHMIKLDVWTGIFKHAIWYNGTVDLVEGAETRAQVTKGNLEIYGRSAQPVAPPPVHPKIGVGNVQVRFDRPDSNNNPSVQFRVFNINIKGMKGRRVQLSFDVAQDGKWLDPINDAAEEVVYDPANWDKRTYFYPNQYLDDKADTDRPFVGAFYVLDADSGQEIFRKEINFKVP